MILEATFAKDKFSTSGRTIISIPMSQQAAKSLCHTSK